MDVFREPEFPFDWPRACLADTLASIRVGFGDSLFKRILEDIRCSNPIFVMTEHNDNAFYSNSNASTRHFTLGKIRLVWRRPDSRVVEIDRGVVFIRLKHLSPSWSVLN
jgi:hypothetical protein